LNTIDRHLSDRVIRLYFVKAEEAVGYAAELRRLDGPPDAYDAIAARVRHVIASAFEVKRSSYIHSIIHTMY
jgi:hypothetical protein